MLPGLLGVGVVSLFANLPMLAGPLYMMQIYDRVLTSGSVQTLVALTVLVIGLYAVFCLLDGIRARMLTRLAALYEARRAAAVFKAMMGNLTQRWLGRSRSLRADRRPRPAAELEIRGDRPGRGRARQDREGSHGR